MTEIEEFYGMTSSYPEVQRTFHLARRFSPRPGPVLLLGATGTGKEYFAQAVHQISGRKGPLVPINCGSLGSLMESELFGYEKGAFTGALHAKKGAFESAHGGTIFLDEVGEMPIELQPKMLRVLEVGRVRRVGAAMETEVDVRVIAATHRDLVSMVTKGTFREDLYHRLAVYVINTIPLAGRPRDISVLAARFAATEGATITPDAMAVLEAYAWPGNVRELKNMITRGAALADDGVIRIDHLEFPGRTVRVTSAALQIVAGDVRMHRTRKALFGGGHQRGRVRSVSADGAVVVDLLGSTGLIGVSETWPAEEHAADPGQSP